jgi:hypothetical protein
LGRNAWKVLLLPAPLGSGCRSARLPGARRGFDPSGGIRVIVNMAIIVVMAAEAGIGIIDYELIADIRDVPQGVFRVARPNGRRGGCTQQHEEHDLCHDASP